MLRDVQLKAQNNITGTNEKNMKMTPHHNTTRCYLCIGIMSFIVAGTAAFGQTFYSQTVSNDNPLAYWNFDETNGNAIQQMPVPASPTTVNDLTPVGTATRVAHSAIGSGLLLGNAASFDGTCNFDTPNPDLSALSALPGPYAIEFWFQGESIASEYAQTPLSFTGSGSVAIYYNNGGPGALDMFAVSGRTGEAGVVIPVTDHNWHYVMYVFYGSLRNTDLLDGYLDGVCISNIPCSYNQSLPLLGPLSVGDYSPTGGAGFYGRMDELALYDWTSDTNMSASLLSAKATAMASDHIRAATVDAAGVAIDITQQPVDAVESIGATATFTVAATVSGGGSPLTYQWQENWTNIPNATNASYTTPTLGASDSGTIFRAQVSSGSVFVNSQTASLTIGGLVITITQQPANVTASVGGTATFSVVASSFPPAPLSYQWEENAVAISGATNSSYTTPALQPEDSGTNFFSVEISVGAVITNSDVAELVVATPPPPNTYYSQAVSNDLPVLYWDFDEAKGNAIQQMPVPASPTTANDLVPVLGAHRAVHATIGSGLNLGYCAEFNGSDNFNAVTPNPSELGLYNAFGIEFWIQGEGNSSEACQTPVSFTDSGSITIYYNNGGPGALDMFAVSGRTGMNGVVIPTSDHNWHYVMYVFYGSLRSSNLLDGYLDGVRIPNIPCTYNSFIPLNGPITVGDYHPAGGCGFNGRMDELALYDFSSFSDETNLTSYVEDMVARHRAAAIISPVLSFTYSDGQLTLSWPVAGMVLQETASLSRPVVWADVSGGSTSPVTVTNGPGTMFFRLSSSP
jgi:hypothetical protein